MTAQQPLVARLRLDPGAPQSCSIDFSKGVSLAIELAFNGPQPRHFGAPPATSTPFVIGGFNGEVSRGASCNCRSLTLVPHCNGTHTESVGHLTVTGESLHGFVPAGPLPALLLSLRPQRAAESGEDSEPQPQPDDLLLTRADLRNAWPAQLPFQPTALLLRTLPNDVSKLQRDYSGGNPPFLSRQLATEIVALGITHLVLDLPSADRSDDGGRLTAHRIFFGLPPGSARHADASRPHSTITELAWMPDSLLDGCYALQLQLPAFSGDAVPSRPVLFPLVTP
ncbi:MAG: cyclase family protein [Pseudomonadota bacterium]